MNDSTVLVLSNQVSEISHHRDTSNLQNGEIAIEIKSNYTNPTVKTYRENRTITNIGNSDYPSNTNNITKTKTNPTSPNSSISTDSSPALLNPSTPLTLESNAQAPPPPSLAEAEADLTPEVEVDSESTSTVLASPQSSLFRPPSGRISPLPSLDQLSSESAGLSQEPEEQGKAQEQGEEQTQEEVHPRVDADIDTQYNHQHHEYSNYSNHLYSDPNPTSQNQHRQQQQQHQPFRLSLHLPEKKRAKLQELRLGEEQYPRDSSGQANGYEYRYGQGENIAREFSEESFLPTSTKSSTKRGYHEIEIDIEAGRHLQYQDLPKATTKLVGSEQSPFHPASSQTQSQIQAVGQAEEAHSQPQSQTQGQAYPQRQPYSNQSLSHFNSSQPPPPGTSLSASSSIPTNSIEPHTSTHSNNPSNSIYPITSASSSKFSSLAMSPHHPSISNATSGSGIGYPPPSGNSQHPEGGRYEPSREGPNPYPHNASVGASSGSGSGSSSGPLSGPRISGYAPEGQITPGTQMIMSDIAAAQQSGMYGYPSLAQQDMGDSYGVGGGIMGASGSAEGGRGSGSADSSRESAYGSGKGKGPSAPMVGPSGSGGGGNAGGHPNGNAGGKEVAGAADPETFEVSSPPLLLGLVY